MKKKRGAVIMPVIITVIGIALFLAIMIFFFGGIPWTSTIDKEACHNSVIQRATFNAGPIEAGKTAIPLNCKTEKICISKSGDDCDAFPPPTRDKPVTKADVDYNEDARVAVMDQIAESMYECHSMLGEGKVNFMPHKTWEENYCLICARIDFDEQIAQEVQTISYGALYRHLQQKKDPDGKSYLSFIYPEWESWEAVRGTFDAVKEANIKKSDGSLKNMEFEDWEIDLTRENGYAIIAMMQTQGRWKQYAGTATVVAGTVIAAGAILAAPFTGGTSLSLVAVGIAVSNAAAVAGGGIVLGGVTYWYTMPDGNKYHPPTIRSYDIPTLSTLDCSSFETAP